MTTTYAAELTEVQAAILSLLAAGKTTRAIREELDLSEGGMQYHLFQIRFKLGAHTMAHAVAKAFKLGLLT